MPRDLHDLLGHTLSMIALKSELAGRLVEQEPARAIQEIREVERVARQTLREGVTNVIRHSHARWCCIHITRGNSTARAEVTNDGCREQELLHQGAGSGLAGLTERVKTHGGRIEALPMRLTEPEASHGSGVVSRKEEEGLLRVGGKEGFRLLVELPILSSGEAVREEQS